MDTGEFKLHLKTTLLVFLLIIFGLAIANFIAAPPEILRSERRFPAALPPLTVQTVISAEYMDRFEDYAADNFVFREIFRSLRAVSVYGLFMQTDKDGIFFGREGAGEFEPVDIQSFEQVADKISLIADSLSGINIYYAFIPDKSIYFDRAFPGFDPELAKEILTGRLGAGGLGTDNMTFIDLTSVMDIDTFYRTDFHWDQVKLENVVRVLGEEMGFDIDLSQYQVRNFGEFEGVFVGQVALPIGKDSLYYFDFPHLTALYLNVGTMEMEPGPVYDYDRFWGLDPYDFFLSCAQPLVILENDNLGYERVLYLFRDSFSSSLAPLLSSAYSQIVLIDLRYIDFRTISQLVDFKPGSDALFLYSTQVLNNSDFLLVW